MVATEALCALLGGAAGQGDQHPQAWRPWSVSMAATPVRSLARQAQLHLQPAGPLARAVQLQRQQRAVVARLLKGLPQSVTSSLGQPLKGCNIGNSVVIKMQQSDTMSSLGARAIHRTHEQTQGKPAGRPPALSRGAPGATAARREHEQRLLNAL